jgi:hypothetical protein
MEAYNLLIYFQLFHIIVIIYQNYNVKVHFKILKKKTNLKYIFINNDYDGEKWDCKLGSRLCYIEDYLLQNSFFFFFFNYFSKLASDATFVRLEAVTRFSIPNLCSEEKTTTVIVCCRCWVCCLDCYELFFHPWSRHWSRH